MAYQRCQTCSLLRPCYFLVTFKNFKDRENHFPREALCMLNTNENLYVSDSDSEDQNSLELSEEEP